MLECFAPVRTRESPSEPTSGSKCLSLRTKENYSGRHVKELTPGVQIKSPSQSMPTRVRSRGTRRESMNEVLVQNACVGFFSGITSPNAFIRLLVRTT